MMNEQPVENSLAFGVRQDGTASFQNLSGTTQHFQLIDDKSNKINAEDVTEWKITLPQKIYQNQNYRGEDRHNYLTPPQSRCVYVIEESSGENIFLYSSTAMVTIAFGPDIERYCAEKERVIPAYTYIPKDLSTFYRWVEIYGLRTKNAEQLNGWLFAGEAQLDHQGGDGIKPHIKRQNFLRDNAKNLKEWGSENTTNSGTKLVAAFYPPRRKVEDDMLVPPDLDSDYVANGFIIRIGNRPQASDRVLIGMTVTVFGLDVGGPLPLYGKYSMTPRYQWKMSDMYEAVFMTTHLGEKITIENDGGEEAWETTLFIPTLEKIDEICEQIKVIVQLEYVPI